MSNISQSKTIFALRQISRQMLKQVGNTKKKFIIEFKLLQIKSVKTTLVP
jgi:hypothetical protein